MKCSIKIPRQIIELNYDELIDTASNIDGIIAFQIVHDKQVINLVFDENYNTENKIKLKFEDLYFTLE